MKTLLITAIVAAIVAITAIKEDYAEALFKSWVVGCTLALSCVNAWITAKLQKRKIRRIREVNRVRRDRMQSSVKHTELVMN
jgi:undecaprenyl pyrophosphate phosphatase UppP